MKKLLLIVGGLAVFFTVGLFFILWYAVSKMEFEKNKAKTRPARDARWKKVDPENESDVNKLLDDINNNKDNEAKT